MVDVVCVTVEVVVVAVMFGGGAGMVVVVVRLVEMVVVAVMKDGSHRDGFCVRCVAGRGGGGSSTCDQCVQKVRVISD